MAIQALPRDAESILALTWSNYEPCYHQLESRPLNSDTVDTWLADWSRLAETADEQYWRIYIATTINTADLDAEAAFNKYIEGLQPAIKIAEQKLKDKLRAIRFI